MKYTVAIIALALTCAQAVVAADIKLVGPADKSVLRGAVELTLQTQHEPGEDFLQNPVVTLSDETGQELLRVDAVRDLKTGTCSVPIDTLQLKDGLYNVAIVYKTLRDLKVTEVREDLSFGVRNAKRLPAKVAVKPTPPAVPAGTPCDITVIVTDEKGRLMPAARVAVTVDHGDVNTDAEITGSKGEATFTVNSDDAQDVTLRIVVDNLPAVTRVVHFSPV